ncbi:MAG: GntR family transcriptional regulator [Planctomycetota bacterium]|jgi:DNA-binding GntR family transcriptional regulator
MRSKYKTIAEDIRQNVKKGIYARRLPSEKKLASEFKTTQMTIRKALSVLTSDGFLVTRPSIGTFVAENVKAKFRMAFLEGMYDDETIKQFSDSLENRFPAVGVEFANTRRLLDTDSFYDIIRAANLCNTPYSDFAARYPDETIDKLYTDQYYKAAFDIHRVNDFFFGIPILFSPIVCAADKTMLQQAGVDLDPYSLDFNALFKLKDAAVKNKRYLWDMRILHSLMFSILFSAGDDSERLANIDINKLKNLLDNFKPLLDDKLILPQEAEYKYDQSVLHFCCRQAVYMFDTEKTAIMAIPEEIRKRTQPAGEFLLINRDCENPVRAAKVAAHFLSPEIQNIIGQKKIGIPVLKSAALESMDSSTFRDDVFFNEVENVCTSSGSELRFLLRFHLFIDDMIAGKMSYQEFLFFLDYEIKMAKNQAQGESRVANNDLPMAVHF